MLRVFVPLCRTLVHSEEKRQMLTSCRFKGNPCLSSFFSSHVGSSFQKSIADVENQSVLTNRARPGRSKTQLSAVLPVSAAGFSARTLVMAPSHVAVGVIIDRAFAVSHQFPTLLAEQFTDDHVPPNLQNCWCHLWWSRHNAFAPGFSDLGIADDTARHSLDVLGVLMAVIQVGDAPSMVGDTNQGGPQNQRKFMPRTCTNSTAMLSFRVAGARTRALT